MKICEPDLLVRSEAAGAGDNPGKMPNDPMLPKQWAIDAIGAPSAWKTGAFGSVTPPGRRVLD